MDAQCKALVARGTFDSITSGQRFQHRLARLTIALSLCLSQIPLANFRIFLGRWLVKRVCMGIFSVASISPAIAATHPPKLDTRYDSTSLDQACEQLQTDRSHRYKLLDQRTDQRNRTTEAMVSRIPAVSSFPVETAEQELYSAFISAKSSPISTSNVLIAVSTAATPPSD